MSGSEYKEWKDVKERETEDADATEGTVQWIKVGDIISAGKTEDPNLHLQLKLL